MADSKNDRLFRPSALTGPAKPVNLADADTGVASGDHQQAYKQGNRNISCHFMSSLSDAYTGAGAVAADACRSGASAQAADSQQSQKQWNSNNFLHLDFTSSNLTRSNPALPDSCPDAASGESEQAEQQRDRNEFTHVAFTSSGFASP